jgi:hypothetical protein
MAATIKAVQNCAGAGAGGGSSLLAMGAFAANPANGDVIVVMQAEYNTASAAVAPTDSAGNTYTQIGTTVKQSVWNANTGMSYWAASNITGGSSFIVTVHHTNNNHCAVAWCLTGVAASPYNSDWKENHGGTQVNPVSGASVGTPLANSIMLAALFQDDNVSASPAAGWNTQGVNGYTAGMDALAQVTFAAAPLKMCTAYKLVSASDSCTWTASIPHAYVTMIASFGPGGGAVSQNTLFFGV